MIKLLKEILGCGTCVRGPAATPEEEAAEKSQKEMWAKWEEERAEAEETFRGMMKPPKEGSYERVALGDYPRESDEVWVEAYSRKAGVSHDDLTGFVVLSELRHFFNTSGEIHMLYREAIKQGCELPVGSSAIKFARRLK